MVKLQNTGKQFYITIQEEHVRRMGWKKGDELYVSKDPEKDFLYIEYMKKNETKKT